MNIFSQEELFLFFFIIGVLIGLIFDFFKVLRKSFETSDIITFIEDLIFLSISSSIIISSIIKLNGGELRFFLFLGIFFGLLIYSLTISNLYVIMLYELIELLKRIFAIIYKIIYKVLIVLKSIIKLFYLKINNIKNKWRYSR